MSSSSRRITSYNVCYTKLLRAKLLEEKWGVSAAAPVAVAAAGPAAAAAPAEEQTEFDVILANAGEKKINVIKEVRAIRNNFV